MGQLRYGFQPAENLFVRVYGQRFDQRHTELRDETDAKDQWNMTQGGFRMDYFPSASTTLTIQGDIYGGTLNDSIRLAEVDGQNLLARFSHSFTEKSSLTIQSFFDRTWRTTPNSANRFYYQLATYDLDIQHRFPVGQVHSILWGGAYRFQRDHTARSFMPLSRDMPVFSGFIQDEISFDASHLKVTIGTKLLDNVFSGLEIQPSARVAWTPEPKHTVWAAVSRAVRVPTRFDSDITVTSQRFDSEKVIAVEAGYRVKASTRVSLSFATFFNNYYHLRSLDTADIPPPPIILANSQRAESWGFEFAGNFQVTENWRLRGGYTFFEKNIWATNPKTLPISEDFEGVDPKNQLMLQSMFDLPSGFQVDAVCRYVESLHKVSATIPRVPSYFTYDVRLAFLIDTIEISVGGQNLLEKVHKETGSSIIPSSAYGKLTWRLP
jgi:iron complex outermembrane receptor protein